MVLARCMLNERSARLAGDITLARAKLARSHMSDRIGNKKSLLAGCRLAAPTYVPIYMGREHFRDPESSPIAEPAMVIAEHHA
jgi:hypothetical protein